MNMYLKYQQPEMVFDVFDFMVDRCRIQPDVITFNSLLTATQRTCGASEGFKLLDKLKQSGIQPNVYFLNSLIRPILRDPHSKTKDVARVVDCIQMMRAQGVTPNTETFLMLLGACHRLGRMELVEEVLKSGAGLDADHFNEVIKFYAKRADNAKAIGLLKEMKSKGIEPNYTTLRIFTERC